ncbi:MAG TPA: TlpA disulfide reductase family protein [Pirellulales bacterium]|nr:TlpA disulfide reductase family protein [Pirellulales bacterium]
MSDVESIEPSHTPRIPRVWLALAFVFALFAAWRILAPSPSQVGSGNPGVGKKLSTLSLQPLTFIGDDISLDDLQGDVVVLNFWGTWCPPCRTELPHVAELARRYRQNEHCRVLAVSCGSSGPDSSDSLPELQSETAALLAARHIDLSVYADLDLRTRKAVNDAVGFRGYPTTLVLDAGGVIRGVWTGYAPGDEQAVAELVEQLLSAET